MPCWNFSTAQGTAECVTVLFSSLSPLGGKILPPKTRRSLANDCLGKRMWILLCRARCSGEHVKFLSPGTLKTADFSSVAIDSGGMATMDFDTSVCFSYTARQNLLLACSDSFSKVAGIAQLVEQLICNQQVRGSIPRAGFSSKSRVLGIPRRVGVPVAFRIYTALARIDLGGC